MLPRASALLLYGEMAAERDIGGTQLQEDNSAAEGSGSQSQADGILSQMAIFMYIIASCYKVACWSMSYV